MDSLRFLARAAAVAATLAPTLFSCPAEAAVCADYWQGTRWVGKVETNRATDIAFTPDHAFIVGRTATTGGTSVIVLDRSVFPPAPIWESPPQELNHLSLSGNYLYVTDFALGLLVYDVSTPTAPVAIGSYPLLYAWDVFVEGDIAYVTTKHNPSSFVVLDVSDPTMPTHLGSIGLSAAGMGLDVDGDLAVVALGGNGFSVVDVSVPTQPMHLVTTPLPFDVALDVALEGDVACIAGRPSGSILANGGVVLVDLSTPSHPVIRSKLDGYVQSIARLGDVMAFLGMRVDAYSRRIDGAHFFDISDPANPEPLVDCPGRRASDSDRAVFDGPHLYVTAHTIEMIETAGFQGPREEAFTPVVSGLHGFSASGTLGACALSGFLWIYDLSGTFPAPRGSVPGERFDVVLDGTTLLTTTSTSLEIFDVSDPDAPDLVGSVVLPLSPDLIEWEAPFAYVYGEGISVVDCSDLTQPALIQTVTSAVVNADLDVVGDRAFSTGGYFESFDTWVRTFDLFDRNPNGTLSHITRGGDISSAYLSLDAGLRYLGDDILLTTGNFASCIDVSNPASLVVCSTAPLPTTGRQVTLSPNGDPYVACDLGFLVRIDAADPFAPQVRGVYSGPITTHPSFLGDGRLAFAAASISVLPPDCEAVTSALGVAKGGAGLSVVPNPSRGMVSFLRRDPTNPSGRVEVFDVGGRRVWGRVTRSEDDAPVQWDGRDLEHRSVPAGVYFVRWTDSAGSATRKVVRVR